MADDPALEAAAMDVPVDGSKKTRRDMYRDTLDERHLVFVKGKAPVWFHITPMRHGWKRDFVESLPSDATVARAHMALRGACFQITLADERALTTTTETTRSGQRVAPEEWIEEVCEAVGETRAMFAGILALRLTQMAESDRPTSPSQPG